MSDVAVEQIADSQFRKYALTEVGAKRIKNELAIYELLGSIANTPRLLSYNTSAATPEIILEYLYGESLKEWLDCNDNYEARPKTWPEAKERLNQYISAEMSLLNNGILYRDFNLEHLIFKDSSAYFVDLEACIPVSGKGKYFLDDMRGTWETMAPEEFSGRGLLSARAATYRVAVIAHIVLCGRLPFKRDAYLRSKSLDHRSKPLRLGDSLSKAGRKLFTAALSNNEVHRHKDPSSFMRSLEKAMLA